MEKLTTKRTILRSLQLEDAEDLYEYSKLDNVSLMIGRKLHESIEYTKKYIEHEMKKDGIYAIELKTDHKVIGTIGLRKQDSELELDTRMVRIVLNPEYWGKGYAQEVTKELIRYVFEEVKIDTLTVGHFTFNVQSESVIKKLGFNHKRRTRVEYINEGEFVDAEEYYMTCREYKEKYEQKKHP